MDIDGFAVAAAHEAGAWRCSLLDDALLDDLPGLLAKLRNLASDGAAVFAMVEVDEEYFAIVRPRPAGAALLVSDSVAAWDYDLASDLLEMLEIPTPDEDDVDDMPWPEGDVGILSDFGVSEQEMQIILDDIDLYPDEQVQRIADRCGFGAQLAALVDSDDD